MIENSLSFGRRAISRKEPPLVLPDVGTFFGQSEELAGGVIDRLIEQGAEAVKGELLHDISIVMKTDLQETFFEKKANRSVDENYYELIRSKIIDLTMYERVFRPVIRRGLPCIFSVYDKAGAQFAVDVGAAGLKIASSNVNHQSLIEDVAATGLPVIIDTGKSYFWEACRAAQWARAAGCAQLLLEYSPPAPPGPPSDHNLRRLQTYRRVFGEFVGLSDHHDGDEAMLAAAALGAVVLEKGVRPSTILSGQDVAHAAAVDDFGALQRRCHTVHAMLGDTRPAAPSAVKASRMGLVARRDLKPGDVLTNTERAFAFPIMGVPAEHAELVAGWEIVRPVRKGAPIDWPDLRAPSDERTIDASNR